MGIFKKILLLALLVFAGANPAFAEEEIGVGDLPNFREVVPQRLYRGGQPSDVGLQTLAQKFHIKIIIDLRNEDPRRLAQEKVLGHSLGINVMSFPMSPLRKPSDSVINQIEAILNASSVSQPIYVHCLHGEDRTGLVIGLFRVLDQNENPQGAYIEMLDDGFHKFYLELRKYFCIRTGYCP